MHREDPGRTMRNLSSGAASSTAAATFFMSSSEPLSARSAPRGTREACSTAAAKRAPPASASPARAALSSAPPVQWKVHKSLEIGSLHCRF